MYILTVHAVYLLLQSFMAIKAPSLFFTLTLSIGMPWWSFYKPEEQQEMSSPNQGSYKALHVQEEQ